MFGFENIINLFMDNIKTIFFPEEWINLDLKFSKTEFFTLFLLERNTEITMSELAEYLNAPMSTATGIVDRLVKNKFIKRGRSDFDRRIVVLKLEDQGLKLIEDVKNKIEIYFNTVTNTLSEEEKISLINIILKIINNIQTNKKDEEITETKIEKIDIE